jgi:hypothetical protein
MGMPRRFLLFYAAALVLAGALPAQARSASHAELATAWYDFAARVNAELDPELARTPAEDLAQSRMALAMFEAVNATRPRYLSYLGMQAAPADTDGAQAANAAAHAVMDASFPVAREKIDVFYAKQITGVDDGLGKTRASLVGEHAAALVLARPALDASVTYAPYRPETQPGRFTSPGLPDIEPYAVALHPWFLASPSALRPGPPPPLDSAAYAESYNLTRTLGARASTQRTPGQTEAARFWLSYSYTDAVHQAAARTPDSLLETTRFYALFTMAVTDARIALGDAKMHYLTWRPITAIRNGDRTGNTNTPRDAGWLPLVPTAVDPEYPSGHSGMSAAIAVALGASTGNTADTRYTFRSKSLPTASRSLTLTQYAQIVPMARIWGGSHFHFSTEAGSALGRQVAELAVGSFAPKVK